MSANFRLRNDLYCVEWGVKLYSLTHPKELTGQFFCPPFAAWIILFNIFFVAANTGQSMSERSKYTIVWCKNTATVNAYFEYVQMRVLNPYGER